MILTEPMAIGMLLSIFLTILGYKMRSWPVVLISSISWVIIGLRYYDLTSDFLPLGLMVTVAMVQVFIVPEGKRR